MKVWRIRLPTRPGFGGKYRDVGYVRAETQQEAREETARQYNSRPNRRVFVDVREVEATEIGEC